MFGFLSLGPASASSFPQLALVVPLLLFIPEKNNMAALPNVVSQQGRGEEKKKKKRALFNLSVVLVPTAN